MKSRIMIIGVIISLLSLVGCNFAPVKTLNKNRQTSGGQQANEQKVPQRADNVDFFDQLQKYVDNYRSIFPLTGELSLGEVPVKLEEQYALPAVISLNHYLAEQQYETWSAWPQHPDRPVLVQYEVLEPDRGSMDLEIYFIGVRMYWATFDKNPMVNVQIINHKNDPGYETKMVLHPTKTWYEDVIFKITAVGAEKIYQGSGAEVGSQGWTVEKFGAPLASVETKGLPLLFDIPYPSKFRGE